MKRNKKIIFIMTHIFLILLSIILITVLWIFIKFGNWTWVWNSLITMPLILLILIGIINLMVNPKLREKYIEIKYSCEFVNCDNEVRYEKNKYCQVHCKHNMLEKLKNYNKCLYKCSECYIRFYEIITFNNDENTLVDNEKMREDIKSCPK